MKPDAAGTKKDQAFDLAVQWSDGKLTDEQCFKQKAAMEAGDKAYPSCAETIKAAAIVCKHSGRDLPKDPAIEQAAQAEHQTGDERESLRQAWHYSKSQA